MADKTQQVMWTALPNGLDATHGAYRVSVLVSPRLTRTANVPPSLDQFPDFVDWPDMLSHARIDFAYGNVAITTATAVSVPNSKTWAAVFPPTTLVRSHEFEDRRDNTVLSYP